LTNIFSNLGIGRGVQLLTVIKESLSRHVTQEPNAGSYEYRTETWCYTKGGEFLD